MAEQDITQTGPVGLRGLRGLNRTNSNPVLDDYDLFKSNYNMPSTKSDWLNGENSPYGYTSALEDHTEQAFNVGFGDYNVDRKIGRAEQLNNIYNTRGELQSTASQLLNALGQGITTMGTTFLNGTVGLVVGAITATDRGDLSGMWDNDFARSMDSINKWSEEAMPMHMTDRERESVWNQGIGNFVGNLILKPAGFVAGAALSGGAWSKLATGAVKGLSAAIGAGKQVNSGTQFLNNLNNAKNLVKTGNITSKAVGAITSTAGEAAIEALNNSNEKYEANKQSIDQYYGSLVDTQLQDIYQKMPDIDPKLALELAVNEADAKFNYNEALSKLEEDRISTGNLDYMLNFPILMASNLWQAVW